MSKIRKILEFIEGLSAHLECVVFKSNASTFSFWNKANYERMKQGNLMIFLTIYRIHQNKSFLFHFSLYRVI